MDTNTIDTNSRLQRGERGDGAATRGCCTPQPAQENRSQCGCTFMGTLTRILGRMGQAGM